MVFLCCIGKDTIMNILMRLRKRNQFTQVISKLKFVETFSNSSKLTALLSCSAILCPHRLITTGWQTRSHFCCCGLGAPGFGKKYSRV